MLYLGTPLVVGQHMSRRYQIVRDRIVKPGGGFIEAFRMAIVEFAALGEHRFDLTGYPYASGQDALVRDWAELGKDLSVAEGKLRLEGSRRDVEADPAIEGKQLKRSSR